MTSMASVSRFINAPPSAVFDVLSDGWLFAGWVVGASRIRHVDPMWPGVGSKVHYSIGVWPGVINDSTSVTCWDPSQRLQLRARGWPLGEADVTLSVRRHRRGSITQMTEHAVRGPAVWVPKVLQDIIIRARNHEALKRLGWLAQGKHTQDALPST